MSRVRSFAIEANVTITNTGGVDAIITTGGTGIAARGFTAVYGEGNSFSGTGVFGYAPQVGGNTIGVRGQSESQTGKGVWGVRCNPLPSSR